MRRRGEATWTNMSDLLGTDWVAQIPTAAIGTPDSPVRQFVVHFIRQSDGRSLAPGMANDPFNQVLGAFKPFIHPDTEVYVESANLVKTAGDETAVWRRVHNGVITDDAWPGEDVVATCKSLDWLVEDTDIEEEEARGAPDPGTPLDDEVQSLVDRWMDEPVTVFHPDGAGIGVGPYKPAVGKLGAQIRALAARQAWDARYMWDEATNSEQYTLYDPPRDKTTPDLVLAADQVREVTEVGESSDSVRNDFVYIFIDETGRQVTRTRRTVYPVGSPSYRRRFMRIVDTEVVKTIAQADAVLASADNDISKPLAQKRIRINYNPYLQLHDVIQTQPDDIRFDTSTIWAIVGGNHSVTPEDRYTELELRGGGPVGQFHRWKVREAGTVPDDLDARSLYDVWEGVPQADGSLAPTWKRMPLVNSVRGAAAVFPLPERSDHRVQLLGGTDSEDVVWPSQMALLRTDSILIPPAPQGYYSLAYVQPYDALLRQGRPWTKIMHGVAPEIRLQSLVFTENEGGTESTAHLVMIDPRGVLSAMVYYLVNVGVQTGPFAATLVSPLTWEVSYALHPDHPVGITFHGQRNDGWPDWVYGPLFGDTDKVPRKPDVRLILGAGAARTAYVDSPDTDAVGHLYRLVTGGVEGPDVAIAPRGSDARYGAFNVTASEGGQLVYHVYAYNAADVLSVDYFDLRVDAYIPLGDYGGPALQVEPVSGPTEYLIYWGGDNVTLSINHGAYGSPPASPITVARPAIGAAPLDYTFKGTLNGVEATDSVNVLPLDADTVTPDLTVAQTAGNTNNATQGFTASATNPRTAASLPVTVRLVGCSGTNNGVALPADTDQTVAGAIVVTRPVFGSGNGTARFSATISGGGREEIAYTIPAVQRDTVGPSVTVTPGSFTPTNMPISWVADAGTSILITAAGTSITYNTGSSTSATGTLTATRPAAGSAPGVVSFTVLRDGITNTNTVTVPPVGADTVTPDLTVTPGAADNYTIAYTASAVNPRTGVALASVDATLKGVTATGPGGTPTYADGATVTMAPASVLIVNRPVHGAPAGTVTFKATITSAGEIYGASETIQRTIPSTQALGVAVRLVVSETATTGTLTLTPVPGATITKIETSTKAGNGTQTAYAEIFTPFTTNVTLVEKHTSYIFYRVYNGANIIQEGSQTYDLGDVADVTIMSVTGNGGGTGLASVVVKGDSDTPVGLGYVKYSLAGGTVTDATVGADRSATFNVAQAATVQTLEVWGYNASSVQGPVARAEVPAGAPQVLSAAVAHDGGDAQVTVRFNEYSWAGTGAARYRVDGGTAVAFDVNSDRIGAFTVARSLTADTLVEIAGSTQSGAWGVWFPLPVEKYTPPAPALLTAMMSVDDDGTDDEYTLTVGGNSMAGFSLEVQFYKAGVLVSTETFTPLADDEENILMWTHTGGGDGVAQQHYSVSQMYDPVSGANYGAPVPSRKILSII